MTEPVFTWTTDTVCSSLEEVWSLTAQTIKRAAQTPGIHLIATVPGGGKTTATWSTIKELRKADKTVAYFCPTKATRDEFASAHGAEVLQGKDKQTCLRFKASWAAAKAVPGQGHRPCRGCSCPLKENRRKANAAPVTVATHSWLLGGHDGITGRDLVVIDESPLAMVLAWVELDQAALKALERAGDIEVSPDLSVLLEASKLGALKKAGGCPLPIRNEDTGAELHVSHLIQRLSPDFNAGMQAIEEASMVRWSLGGLDQLEEAPPGAALQALDGEAWKAPGASYIRNGKLYLPLIRPLPAPAEGQSIIVLSATDTPDTLAALYPGINAQCHRVDLDQPPELKVIHIKANIGAGAVRSGAFTSARKRDTTYAVRSLFDGPDTVHVTMKATLDNAASPDLEPLFGSLKGQTIYHNGPVARGSNQFQNARTIVIDGWRVPGLATKSLGSVMAYRTTSSCPGMSLEDWEMVARAQLESAPQIQVTHRIRCALASDTRPVTVVWVDTRAPTTRLLRPTLAMSGEFVAWCVGGRLRSCAVPEVIGEVLRQTEGVWIPSQQRLSSEDVIEGWIGTLVQSDSVPPSFRELQNKLGGAVTHIEKRRAEGIFEQIKAVFQDRWSACAAHCGVELAYLDNPRGGKVAVLSHKALTGGDLATLHARLWPGTLDDEGWKAKIFEHWKRARQSTATPKTRTLIRLANVERRTFYRRCRGQLNRWKVAWEQDWRAASSQAEEIAVGDLEGQGVDSAKDSAPPSPSHASEHRATDAIKPLPAPDGIVWAISTRFMPDDWRHHARIRALYKAQTGVGQCPPTVDVWTVVAVAGGLDSWRVLAVCEAGVTLPCRWSEFWRWPFELVHQFPDVPPCLVLEDRIIELVHQLSKAGRVAEVAPNLYAAHFAWWRLQGVPERQAHDKARKALVTALDRVWSPSPAPHRSTQENAPPQRQAMAL